METIYNCQCTVVCKKQFPSRSAGFSSYASVRVKCWLAVSSAHRLQVPGRLNQQSAVQITGEHRPQTDGHSVSLHCTCSQLYLVPVSARSLFIVTEVSGNNCDALSERIAESIAAAAVVGDGAV